MIEFAVDKQKIKIKSMDQVVADSIKYLKAHFTFTEDWIGYEKIVHFVCGSKAYDMLLTNDQITKEDNLCLGEGTWKVSVHGVSGESRITTGTIAITVEKSGLINGEPFPGITLTAEEKLLGMYNMFKTDGDGSQYLGNDGEYHEISGGLQGPQGETGEQGEVGPQGADGISAYQSYVNTTTDNPVLTEAEWSASNQGLSKTNTEEYTPTENYNPATKKYVDDVVANVNTDLTQEEINAAVSSHLTAHPIETDYRFKAVAGTLHGGYCYNYSTKECVSTGYYYNCIEYTFDGTEKKIRFSGANTGASTRVAYCFTDSSNNAITYAEFVANQTYKNVVVDVPTGATKVYINGNNYESPHLEVYVKDTMADSKYLPQLLTEFGKKIQYKDTFAWKTMDTGYFAFTFDDSLDDVPTIVDLFEDLEVPCCFGAIPDKLNMYTNAGETIAAAMHRAVANGGEVLAHGNNDEIVTSANIDDENFLYKKFLVNKQKFADAGFNVRGCVRAGGSDASGNENICNDARTDKWMRLLFDYGDLYGIAEPYNHERITMASTVEGMQAQVDEAITNKEFLVFLFHGTDETSRAAITTAVQYIQTQGGQIKNYAYVYDTFGSTIEKEEIEARIKAIEEITDGNEVEY